MSIHQKYSLRFARRAYDRFKVEASGEMLINEKVEKPVVVKDVCVRGAGIVSDFPLKVKEKVTIRIISPLFGGPIYRKAEVVWAKEVEKDWWNIGLDFGVNNIVRLVRS